MWKSSAIIVTLIFLHFAAAGEELVSQSFFKSISGHWLGAGQLVNAEGEVTGIQEDWTGSFLDDASFEMKGTRLWGG